MTSPADAPERIWAPDAVLRLNETQVARQYHPYTCPNRGDGEHRVWNGDLGALVATVHGWICPFCEYTQAWASAPPPDAPDLAAPALQKAREEALADILQAYENYMYPHLRADTLMGEGRTEDEGWYEAITELCLQGWRFEGWSPKAVAAFLQARLNNACMGAQTRLRALAALASGETDNAG